MTDSPDLSEMPTQPDLTSAPGIENENPTNKLHQEFSERLKALPEETQLILLQHAADLTSDIIAQSTDSEGNIKPNNDFYRKRAEEVRESGLFNPHEYPQKKIS